MYLKISPMVRFLVGLSLFFTFLFVNAGTQPKFSLIPTTLTTKQVMSNDTDVVQYRVTNNTTITRTLTIKSRPGVTQNTAGTGFCSNPFTLAPRSSCLLTLDLNGSQMDARVVGGPEVCKTRGPGDNRPDPYLCSQPSAADSLNITVIPSTATLTSIDITPYNPTIPRNTTLKFTATGTYSDGSKLDLTSLATWSSSNTNTATISNTAGSQGVATAGNVVVTSTTSISATFGGITGNRILTVNGASLDSIVITPTNPSIPNGYNQQFIATGIFSNGSTYDITGVVNWTSSASSVATISNTQGTIGLASAVSPGSSTITATLGAVSGNTNLTVTAATLTSIAVTPVNSSIPDGTTQSFTATGTFSNGTTHNITTFVTWTSSNSAIASVSDTVGSKGLAKGINPGTTTIVATLGNLSGSSVLTVTTAALTSISITPVNASIPNGTTLQYTAIGIYSNNSTKDLTSTVIWTSSNIAVAHISNGTGSEGLATTVAQGTTIISASLGSISNNTQLTVTNATLSSIIVTPIRATVSSGLTKQFIATGIFSDGNSHDISALVTWNSSSNGIATISNALGSKGLATGIAVGGTTITATLGAMSGSRALTVTGAILNSITVEPINSSVAAGLAQQFSATGNYSDSTTEDLTDTVTWSSSNPSIAAISNADGSRGLATTINTGTTSISATFGSTVGTTQLTVTNAVLNSITVSPLSATVPNGTTEQYTATGVYSNNTIKDLTTSVTWSSLNQSVALISNSPGSQGLVTATSAGATIITAVLGNVTGNANLTVTNPVLTSIIVNPQNPSIPNGFNESFYATGIFSDGSSSDLTTDVTWASSDPSVAQISNVGSDKGKAYTFAVGSTNISAQKDGISGTTMLTVTAATLQSITVTPANSTMSNNSNRQFAATGTFSDSSTQDLTDTVFWQSTSPSVAQISNNVNKGLVTSIAPGITSITATTGSIIGATNLTVNSSVPAITIGTPLQGGIVGCLTSEGGPDNLIVASANNSNAIQWGGYGTAIGVSSESNGAGNTVAIVSELTNNDGIPINSYAAGICSDYEVDSEGNTPCQAGNTCYSDWFLPASSQLYCITFNAAMNGINAKFRLWSSTEYNFEPNLYALGSDGGTTPPSYTEKDLGLGVRCVRSFTP